MERQYRADWTMRIAPSRNIGCYIGIAIWMTFIGWDLFMAHADPLYAEQMPWISAVRGIIGVALILIRAYTYPRELSGNFQTGEIALSAMACLDFSAICLLTALGPSPYDQLYFVDGMMVVMVANFSIPGISMRLLPKLVALHALLIAGTLAYMQTKAERLTGIAAAQLPTTTVVFALSLLVIGIASNLLVELFARQSFIVRTELQRRHTDILKQGQELMTLNSLLAEQREDIRTHLQAQVALKEQLRRDAELREQEKSTFIATAVHDLRQPVQAIVTALAPLRSAIGRHDLDIANSVLDLSCAAAASLQEQLSAILDISRIESGGIRPQVDIVDVGQLCRHLLRDWVTQGRTFGVEVSLTVKESVHAESDKALLRRILNNLVNNAIKYSDPHKSDRRVNIRIESAARLIGGQLTHLAIMVEDNGIGIAPQAISDNTIFKPFVQGRHTGIRGDHGVGLGLAIVSGLTRVLPGHALIVQSDIGQGSCFTITLPHQRQRHLNECAPPLDLQPTQDLQGLYLVLVEDEPLVRAATQQMLSDQGMHVEACASVDAFKVLCDQMERLPDVILTDFRLSHGDTAEDIQRLTRLYLGDIPLVVFTGESRDFSDIPDLADIPVLRKPVATPTLIDTLASVCRPAPKWMH